MYRIGQRVVFVDCDLPKHPDVIYPKLNEIVTIHDIGLTPQGMLVLALKEYPKPLRGEVNGIAAICFRPIDETFAEETIARLTKEIKEFNYN
jgi:hypothetical protein